MKRKRTAFDADEFLDNLESFRKNANAKGAWQYFVSLTSVKRGDIKRRLLKWYGWYELSIRDCGEEQADAAMDEALVRALQNFDSDAFGGNDEMHLKRTFLKYAGIYMDGAVKRMIETANHASKHYTVMLVNIKNAYLDLFESADEDLISVINRVSIKYGHSCKYPQKLLKKLRTYFSVDTITIPYGDEGYNMDHVAYVDNGLNDVETESLLKDIRSKIDVTDEEWEIFCEKVFQDLTITEIAGKHGIYTGLVNKIFKKVSYCVASLYQWEEKRDFAFHSTTDELNALYM